MSSFDRSPHHASRCRQGTVSLRLTMKDCVTQAIRKGKRSIGTSTTSNKWLAWMARDLEEFNSSIRESAKQRIRARNDKFLRDRRIAESLGFPIRRATDLAGTSEAPTVEPDVAPQPPAVPQELEAPQPPSDFPAIEHSPGYKMLIVDGQKLRMRPMAVRTIHFIYTEWMRTGNPDVDEETVLKNIPTQQDSLYKAVRHGRRRIWNKMIRRGNAKGTVRLILSRFCEKRVKARKSAQKRARKPAKTRSQARSNACVPSAMLISVAIDDLNRVRLIDGSRPDVSISERQEALCDTP